MTAEEIAEVDATAEIEEAYRHIRSVLASTFVPTIYRRLALYPAAFTLAVDHLSQVVKLADNTNFVGTAHTLAQIPLSGVSLSPYVPEPGVVKVVERYRKANPLNLLFSMSLAGAEARTTRPAMQAPLGPVQIEIQREIFDAHGAFITPGLWRELAPWPVSLRELWLKTREIAQDGRLIVARESVMKGAAAVFIGSELEFLPARIGALLPSSALTDLAWFPTGIATMVVEGEWLHNLIDYPLRKEMQ